jgi:hypothetical protein
MSSKKRSSGHSNEEEVATKTVNMGDVSSKAVKNDESSSPHDNIFSVNERCDLHLPMRSHESPAHGELSGALPPISQRLLRRPDSDGKKDHVIGLLILRNSETRLLNGVIVVGAALVPNVGICKYHQTNDEGHALYKMSFAPKVFVDYLLSHEMIPHQFRQTGFFKSGYAIGACATLSIPKCFQYYTQLNVPESKVSELFPDNGARILPQPKNISEEQERRVELEASIQFLKSLDKTVYESDSKDGHPVKNIIRVEVEEIEIPDPDILERLLCYRVLESNTP